MSDQTPQRPAIDTLIDRERIRGASRMIAENTAPEAVTSDQITQVATDVDTFCRHHKIGRKELAKSVGFGHSTVSEFLAGKYKGDNATMAIQLEQWLVSEEQQRSRPTTTQFVWTNVALQIKSAANYCLDKRNIGLVYGPDTAGIGKTTALQAIHQEMGSRRSSLLILDDVDGSPTGLLKKLCQAMHVDDNGTSKAKFDRVRDRLIGRSHLLLIDQIHYLRDAKDDKPLYILADLYDKTKTAQLWCGTADMVSYLNQKRAKAGDPSLAQIRRRIYPCIDLMDALVNGGEDGRGEPLVTVDQVREMFARNTLKLTAAAARFICALINRPDTGGVGICVKIVEYATMLCEMRNLSSIDVPVIKQAMRHGLTSVRAEDNIQQVEEAESTMRAARAG